MSKKSDFITNYGPWAIVTGASSGIGTAIATALAKEGFNLVLVARRQALLDTLAAELERTLHIQTIVSAADLATPAGIALVQANTTGLDVGLLINNAGREDSGHFLESDPAEALATLDLNVRAPFLLAHHFAPRLAARGHGGMVFLASIVAFQGVPYIANYAATKAYDLILAEGLAAELKPAGIDVLALAPGFTATDLSPDFDFQGTPFSPMPPEAVAQAVIKGLGRKTLMVPGFPNRVLEILGKHVFSRQRNTRTFAGVFAKVLRHKLSAVKKPIKSAA